MIVAEHLRKTFPGKGKKAAPVIAVDDVSFTAHDGQITGLLGPNGAGKTTTMRMLYTLMQPEKGRVLVDGRIAGSVEEKYDAESCRIAVNGEELVLRRYTYVMLHKPAGVLSATEE